MSRYATLSGVNKKLGEGWGTVNGIYRNLGTGFVTQSGVWKKCFSAGLALANLPENSLLSINENGAPVLFRIGKHDYESNINGAGRVLMVRKDLWPDKMEWNSITLNAYAESSVDTWLNGTYKGIFDGRVQSLMGSTAFWYTEGGHSYKEHESGSTLTTLSRPVFLLSYTEFGKNVGKGSNVEGSALPIASSIQTGNANIQWTRTIYWDDEDPSYYALAIGSSGLSSVRTRYLVRPAFTIPNTATVNPEPNADGSYTLLV